MTKHAPFIALTGATGWLGRGVAHSLVRDATGLGLTADRIRALVPNEQDAGELEALGVEVLRGDIREPAACTALMAGGAGGLALHMAGIIHPPGRTWYFDAVNHRGVRNLAIAAREAGIDRLVAVSSNSPFGANPQRNHLFTEDSAYNPYMGYGKSKWRMETMLRNMIASGRGPEIVIIRAPWFYGPYQPPRQTLFFKLISQGKFPLFGDGGNLRSMAYIDNLAQGILRAAYVPCAAGQVYWIADRRPYAMREIIETVGTVLREDFKRAVPQRIPQLPGLISDVARMVDAGLQAVGLYHQKIHVLSEMNLTIACSTGKAERELGYSPEVGLREGMRRSIEWCLLQGHEI